MPRDGGPTRTRLLDAAQELVLQKGFAATTVEEVIAAAGSSKGAFFHHFASKDDLGRALVERYAAGDVGMLEQFMSQAEAAVPDDPAAQLLHFLSALEAAGDDIAGPHSSCLYVSFLGERDLAGHNAQAIAGSVTAWRERVGAKIAAAAPSLPEPRDVADHLWATFEGAFILGRATGDRSHMRRQLAVMRRAMEAWLGG